MRLSSSIQRSVSILVTLAAFTGCDSLDEDLQGRPPASTEENRLNEGDDFPRTVFVHLFEWTWADIAEECETVLGPYGFSAVQVSPPQEHLDIPDDDDPWWTRYQPVSYALESRSGSEAEFADMVARCGAAGVDVYVDTVINHMAGSSSGVGTDGTIFGESSYPGLYGPADFHTCDHDIYDYSDRYQVQNCRLVGLRDLDTGSPYVRQTIADYMNHLVALGVDGFRIDASKHMAAGDIAAILDLVEGDPYVFQEVIDQGGEAIGSREYTGIGDVTEFKYSLDLSRVFKTGDLRWLWDFGEAWQYLPSADGVVFVDNHDNQRGHGGAGDIITHKDGSLYDLVNGFMLAWPYGYPKVMSSYGFHDPDQGPPSHTVYQSNGDRCFEADGWQCEHRWRPIRNMVAFHNATAQDFTTSRFTSDGADRIAFARGGHGSPSLGFIALQRGGSTSWSTWFDTGMPAGEYCDVYRSSVAEDGRGCANEEGPVSPIVVNQDGWAELRVEPNRFVAIHRGQRLD